MDAGVRQITHGPKHHWFGYYDKLQVCPENRLVLGMEVGFEHRSPVPEDIVTLGSVDLEEGDRWTPFGESQAWCWQQGCMLQFVPGTDSTVLWNDRHEDAYVCRVMNLESGERRTVDCPVYAISPDGRTAVSPDFSRVQSMRPGYGYAGLPDRFADETAPSDSGIRRVDLGDGNSELILSIAEIEAFGAVPDPHPRAIHYVNHLLFNTDGSRFVFLHRWRYPDGSRKTRMLTACPDGSDLRVVDGNGLTSHFIWRDPKHILAFSDQPSHGKAFYLFADADSPVPEPVGPDVMTRDGHCTYLPGGRWILNDTYAGAERVQTPYLFGPETGHRVDLGSFPSPLEYQGEWRCDAHPRSARDGSYVIIDSPVEGEGRQMHLIRPGERPGYGEG
jgi:hypothetical protein